MFFNKFRSTKLKHSRKFRTASFFMKGNYWNYFLPRCCCCCFFRTWKFLILVNENSTFMMWKCWCKDDENVMLTDFYLMLHINISVYSFFHFVIFFACFRAERRSQKNENKSVHQCVEMWDVKMHSERSEMFQK